MWLQNYPLKNQRRFPELLHEKAFTPKKAFTTEHVYTRNLLHQRAFTPKGFYTKGTSHQGAFTPERLLHQMHFSAKYFCTRRLLLDTKELLQQKTFKTLHCKAWPWIAKHKDTTLYTDQHHHAPVPHWIARLTQTSATLDCKTLPNAIDYAEQRDPALQKSFLPLFPCSSQCRDNIGQWPFMLGHLPISAFFGNYTHFVVFGKNRKVEHLWLTTPSFGKTSQAQAGACKEDDNLLDIGLLAGTIPQIFWTNRTPVVVKTMILGYIGWDPPLQVCSDAIWRYMGSITLPVKPI